MSFFKRNQPAPNSPATDSPATDTSKSAGDMDQQSGSTTPHAPLVYLVGQCVPDSMLLSRYIRRFAPGAKVERIMSDEALQDAKNQLALFLVNRVLDGSFDDDSGLKVVAAAIDWPGVPLLISNHDDAQQQAVALGALHGFGKAQLGDPSTAERFQAALAKLVEAQ
jgi:hypothetical protein